MHTREVAELANIMHFDWPVDDPRHAWKVNNSESWQIPSSNGQTNRLSRDPSRIVTRHLLESLVLHNQIVADLLCRQIHLLIIVCIQNHMMQTCI